jgi:hypothetical protein
MNIKYRKKGKVPRYAGTELCVYQPDENISGLSMPNFKPTESTK